MRIWAEALIPSLCQKHLCAMWHEGTYAFLLLQSDRPSPYRHHPAFKEFQYAPRVLLTRLEIVRQEMFKRGYHPKVDLIPKESSTRLPYYVQKRLVNEWVGLDEQIAILKQKGCKCNV